MATNDAARELPGREGILDAAARLFFERGYGETTLRDIASEAGVKAGSIYYHFSSKEELLGAALDEGIARITKAVREALDTATDAGAAERIGLAVAAHLEALFEHGPYTAAHVSVFHDTPPGVKAAGLPARDAYETIWTGLLSAARNEGIVDPGVDLTVARLSLLGAMNATLDWYHPGGSRSLADVAATFARIFLEGVG